MMSASYLTMTLHPVVRCVSLICIKHKKLIIVASEKYDPWTLPGGKINPGEDEVTALLREVVEEIQVGVSNPYKLTEYVSETILEAKPMTVAAFVGGIVGLPVPNKRDAVKAIDWIGRKDTEKIAKLSKASRLIFDDLVVRKLL